MREKQYVTRVVSEIILAFLLVSCLIIGGYAQESLTVVGDLSGMTDSYLSDIARKFLDLRKSRIQEIRTPSEVADRQVYISEKIAEALGGFPERTPLKSRIAGTLERDRYRVEKLIFESLPNYYVTANVYVPTTCQPPYPALLGTAGHTANGKAAAIYQRVWISLARQGFLVLAYDPMGQGERSEYFDPELGRSKLGGPTREHTMAGLQCLLTGSNFARYELWDGIRAFDYLLTRPDVDAGRIAVAGNSGGGTQAAYLAVVEPRLAAAVSSCYLTSWDNLWSEPGPQDAEQVFVGFLKQGLDFADFLIRFAPRPFIILSAIQDFFPIEGARATYREAAKIYGILGAADHVGFFEYDDPHGWSKPRREATYRWLEKWLKGNSVDLVEPDMDTELEANLYCTSTGQVSTSLGGETVQTLNMKQAEVLFRSRSALHVPDPATLRSLIANRLGITVDLGGNRPIPSSSTHGEVGRDGYRIEKLSLQTEPGIVVPSLVFVPATGNRKKSAVLYVHSEGKSADAEPDEDIEALVRTGYLVMAPDLRGWGEGSKVSGIGGYTGVYQTTMSALLVGKTMVGMKLDDLLRSFDYLAARSDVDPSNIAIIGKKNGGMLAIFAAALEPRIKKVACEGATPSFMNIIRAKLHEDVTDIVIPGVIKDFDLADLGVAISPRLFWIVNPVTPTGVRIAPDSLGEYDLTRSRYKELDRETSFRILDRPEDWPFQRTYEAWIQAE